MVRPWARPWVTGGNKVNPCPAERMAPHAQAGEVLPEDDAAFEIGLEGQTEGQREIHQAGPEAWGRAFQAAGTAYAKVSRLEE